MLKFAPHSSVLVVGPSLSGKSQLIKQLIRHRFFQEPEPTQIVWFAKYLDKEIFKLPYPATFYEQLAPDWKPPANSLCIFDDLMSDLQHSSQFTEYFTRGVAHDKFRLFYLSQNLFSKGKENRCQSLNANYIILMRHVRDPSSISHLARQVMPGRTSDFMNVYKDATKDAYGYLICNFRQDQPRDYRFYTNVLSDLPIVYTMS